MVSALALVVVLSKGETAIRLTRGMNLIDDSLRILATETELCVPLVRPPDGYESERLSLVLGSSRIERRDFSERQPAQRTLAEVLESQLPSYLLERIPRSLDIVGHVAIVELPSELAPFEEAVGKAILETSPKIRTVMAKAGAHSRDYRVRELRLIAGEDAPITRHREHGCTFELDVRSVFFNPRLSHERLRVASQVQSGETVVDMFAGVGPYSILGAKMQPSSRIYAIDVNPSAFRFLVSNVLTNKVVKNVTPIMGDVRDVIRSKLLGKADRVIMNLPGSAFDFVSEACSSLAEKRGIIHFYSFESDERPTEKASERLRECVERTGRRVRSILATRVVKTVAPYRLQVAVDELLV